jgi:hypothetical protein
MLRTGLGKLDFSVQVLTTGHWPFYKPYDTMTLPPIMQRAVQVRSELRISTVVLSIVH